MKSKQRDEAIQLRREGRSFNEIAKQLSVSKGTLSRWLSGIELSSEQKLRLSKRSRDQGLVGGSVKKEIWEAKRKAVMDSYSPPFDDPVYMLGLGLYWGEGAKYSRSTTLLGSSDPAMLVSFIGWIKNFFQDDVEGFSVQVHHYGDDDEEVKAYWSSTLGIAIGNFIKSQRLTSKSSQQKKGNILPFGTAQVRVKGGNSWVVRVKIEKALRSIRAPIV